MRKTTMKAMAIALTAALGLAAAGCKGSDTKKTTAAADTTAAPAAETTAAEKESAKPETKEAEKPETEEAETEAEKAETENAETEAEKPETKEAETEEAQSVDAVEGSYKIGIIQYIENGAFDDMRAGIIAELEAKGYTEENTEIIYKCAQADAGTLNTLCQGMVDDEVDVVFTIATPATQGMVNLESDVPVFFCAVSSPIAAGVITEFENPDKNATGTSNAIPVDDIFELAKQITPDAKTFGVIYNTSEVNAVNTAKAAKEYLEANDYTCKETTITNSSEVQQAVQSLVGEIDALFVPNDSSIQAAMDQVTEIARENKIPVYGSSVTMVVSGALATVAIDDKNIGAQTADMAIQYLQGTPITEIATYVVPADGVAVNKTTADAIGIGEDAYGEIEGLILFE